MDTLRVQRPALVLPAPGVGAGTGVVDGGSGGESARVFNATAVVPITFRQSTGSPGRR
jgi:hypothetical protein